MRTAKIIAIGLSLLVSGCNLPAQKPGIKEIEQLFLDSYKITTDNVVYQAPGKQEICVIKTESAAPLPVVVKFLDMLSSLGSFSYRMSRVARIENCSMDTTFYLNIDRKQTSRKNEERNHKVLLARTKILRQLQPAEYEGQFGYVYHGLISKRTNLYASIAEYEGVDFPGIEKLRQKNMQEEIFQLLLAGFDVEQKEVPFSILQEMPLQNRDHGKAMTESLNSNPINVCRVDLIMFQVRYPAKHVYADKVTLKDYFRYLGNNYDQLAARADEVIANPVYKDLFVRPC